MAADNTATVTTSPTHSEKRAPGMSSPEQHESESAGRASAIVLPACWWCAGAQFPSDGCRSMAPRYIPHCSARAPAGSAARTVEHCMCLPVLAVWL